MQTTTTITTVTKTASRGGLYAAGPRIVEQSRGSAHPKVPTMRRPFAGR